MQSYIVTIVDLFRGECTSYIHIYIYICSYIYRYISRYISIYLYLYIFIYLYIYLYLRICKKVRIDFLLYIYTYYVFVLDVF